MPERHDQPKDRGSPEDPVAEASAPPPRSSSIDEARPAEAAATPRPRSDRGACTDRRPRRRARRSGPTDPNQVSLPPAGGTTFRFLAIAAAAVVLVLIAYTVLVATEPGQRIENLALRGAELRSDAEREAALGRLSIVTVAIFGIALVSVLAVGFLRGRERLAFVVAGAMGGSVVLAELLKVSLSRPGLVEGPIWLLRNSFPSGSAAVAASIAVGALLIAPDRLRWIVLLLGTGFAAIIVEAVQTAGWHRLSDTIGGVLLVIASASLGLAALATAGLVRPSASARIDRRVRAILLVAGSLVVLLGALLVILPAVFPLLEAPSGARRSILQTAFPLLGLGITVLALALFAASIDGYTLGRASGDERPPAAKRPSGTTADDQDTPGAPDVAPGPDAPAEPAREGGG